ncbi:DUF1772 domain-containing protein [Lacimicrobium sp. SS2-24]|uniref:DUF1772 domain-containing protein n=1 Tax=Lacimicrobium sp. SS2-24 TaxID=2005569 RepID=UPI001AEF6567|nr:DUF1772 domain-containing protein [Lacimicrobium sp. SS2-24]
MLATFEFIATFCALIFTGAAIYINLVEHPARLGLSDSLAVSTWRPSYYRATRMQAPLALISGAAGIALWWIDSSLIWLLAAVLILLVVPYTFAIIMPVNDALQRSDAETDAAVLRQLLIRWGRLHSVRSALALLSSALMLWQLVMP